MSKKTELKDCPFCGSVNIQMVKGFAGMNRDIVCDVCPARISQHPIFNSSGGYDERQTQELAIDKWNRRVS